MGNADSAVEGEQDPQQILDQFIVIKKFQDQRYGDSTLMEHKENKQQVIMREVNSTDEFDHKKGLEKFLNRLQLQHPNTVKLLKCFNKTDSQFCSTFYKTYLIFEFVNNSLEKEIIQRKPQQAYFSEGEIWNAMGGAIQGLAFQQRNNIAHSTIKTGTIYLSEDGQPKVTDTTVFLQLNNFATVLQDKENVPENIYLSPALMQAIQDNNWSPIHNEYKSDVFSFGMTLLTMGLLQYCNDCYDYNEGQFNMQQLESKLFTFSQRYSQDLTQFIMLMLKQDEESRMDFIQLEQILIQQPGQPQENLQQQQQGQGLPQDQQNYQSQQQQQPEEQIEKTKHHAVSNKKQQSPLQDMQEMFQNKQQQIPTNTQQSQQLQQGIQQSPQQQQQLNSVKQSSPQVPQVNQQQQQHQQHQQQQQVYRNNNLPAQGMAREEPDQGTTNNFTPKDFCQEIPKPDENQGNDLGRETYRDDVDQGASYPENQNNYEQENQNNNQQNNQYNHPSYQQQQQQNYNHDQNNQYQNNNQQQQQNNDNVPSSASIDQHKQQSYQPYLQQQQNSYNNQNQTYNQYSSGYKPYTPETQEEKPKHAVHHNQQEQYKPPSQFVENVTAPPVQTLSQKSNEKQNEQQSQNQDQNQNQYQGSNIDDILKKYGVQSYKGPQQYSENKENPNQNQNQQQQQSYHNYQIPDTQQDQQYKQLGEQLNNYGRISDKKETVPKQESEQKPLNPYSNNTNNQYSGNKSNTYTSSYTPYQPQQQYNQQQQQHQDQQPQQQQHYQQPQNNNYQHSTNYSNNYQQQEQKEFVIENYQNGSKYEGEKLNQMRHGKGKFYYQDNGGLYDGNWSYNKMHGKGVLYYGSGKPAYDGDWVEDKFEGFGILFNESPAQLQSPFDYRDFDLVDEFWTKYDGEFKDDNKEGYGTLYLSNGEKFQGTFKQDFVQGAGTYFTLQGNVISGIWHNNKFQEQ